MTWERGTMEAALRQMASKDVTHLYLGGQLVVPGSQDKLRFPARFYQDGEGWAAEVPGSALWCAGGNQRRCGCEPGSSSPAGCGSGRTL